MDAQRLEHIVRTKRGMTYLVNRLREVDPCTVQQAKAQINKIWYDKSKADVDIYKDLAALLVVDDVTITKDQFLKMLGTAIDHCEDYMMDPLEAVHMLVDNMMKNGGLKAIARKLDMFSKKV